MSGGTRVVRSLLWLFCALCCALPVFSDAALVDTHAPLDQLPRILLPKLEELRVAHEDMTMQYVNMMQRYEALTSAFQISSEKLKASYALVKDLERDLQRQKVWNKACLGAVLLALVGGIMIGAAI